MFNVSSILSPCGAGQRRNILILRGVEGVHDARDVEHGCDVRAVVAVAQLRGIACLHRQIAARTRSQRLDYRRAVPIVQNERLLALRQARCLQLRNSVEALRVDFDRQAPGQERSRLRQLGRVGVVEDDGSPTDSVPGETGPAPPDSGPARCARMRRDVRARRPPAVLKSPPVSGARNSSTCCAPSGTVTVNPSLRAFAGPGLAGKEPGLRAGDWSNRSKMRQPSSNGPIGWPAGRL